MSDSPLNKNLGAQPSRWELNTLRENKQDLSKNPIIAKLAQELMDGKQSAIEEGFAKGFEDGKLAGHQEGFQAGLAQGQQQIQESVQFLSEITFNLQKLFAYSKERKNITESQRCCID